MAAPIITKHLSSPLLALVRITPPSTSTIDTSALLTKLQSFGPVLEFRPVSSSLDRVDDQHQHHTTIPSTPVPARPLYAVRFSTPSALQRALAASPVSVTVPAQPPPAAPPDPYDVLQRQARPRPRAAAVFSCTVSQPSLAEQRQQRQQRQQQDQRLVRHRGTAALHDALVESGAPGNLVAGLSLRPAAEVASAEDDGSESGSGRGWQSTEDRISRSEGTGKPLRLMDLYQAAAAATARENGRGER